MELELVDSTLGDRLTIKGQEGDVSKMASILRGLLNCLFIFVLFSHQRTDLVLDRIIQIF